MVPMDSKDQTYQYIPDSVTSSMWPVIHHIPAAINVDAVSKRFKCQSLMTPRVSNEMPMRDNIPQVVKTINVFVWLAAGATRAMRTMAMAKRKKSGIDLMMGFCSKYVSKVYANTIDHVAMAHDMV